MCTMLRLEANTNLYEDEDFQVAIFGDSQEWVWLQVIDGVKPVATSDPNRPAQISLEEHGSCVRRLAGLTGIRRVVIKRSEQRFRISQQQRRRIGDGAVELEKQAKQWLNFVKLGAGVIMLIFV